jgi:hypothetical protein
VIEEEAASLWVQALLRVCHLLASSEWIVHVFARTDLAHVSAALSGKPIGARSLALMAEALARVPANELIDRIVTRYSADLGAA